MRRKDREVININDILNIIDECKVFRVATQDEQGLYIIPLNFGYEYIDNKLIFYFHSAKEGRKVNAFKNNNNLVFEMDCKHKLIESDKVCEYSYAFESVMGSGKIKLLEDKEEKKRAFSIIMKHQTKKDFIFDDKMVDLAFVYKIDIKDFTAKARRVL